MFDSIKDMEQIECSNR